MVAAIEAKVMPLLREGRKPLMDSSFPLEKAADAPAHGDQRTYWQNCVGGIADRARSEGGKPFDSLCFHVIYRGHDPFAGPGESLVAEY